MSFKATLFRDKLKKKAARGFRGYPIATITYYGPDDKRASKVSVGIIAQEGGDVAALERWFNNSSDIRMDATVNQAIVDFLKLHGAVSVAVADRILGCPHEEGVDYPDGEKCPRCAFWASRDRFTGNVIQ